MSDKPNSSFSDFTTDLKKIVKSENVYLNQRRKQYGLEAKNDLSKTPENTWGLAISGGGIRSATLALGSIQTMIGRGIFKFFDYMSTVSGGGYMGACISSLMNNPTNRFFVPEELTASGKADQVPGLEAETNPLVGLIQKRAKDINHPAARRVGLKKEELVLDYKYAEETRLDVRHQIHHLRMHGEYLTPDKSLLSTDVQKAIGTVFAGIVHNLFLFFVTLATIVILHLIAFNWLSDGTFIEYIEKMGFPEKTVDIETGAERFVPKNMWTDGFLVLVDKVGTAIKEYIGIIGMLTFVGFLVSLIALIRSHFVTREYRRARNKIKQGELDLPSHSGHNHENYLEARFMRTFNATNLLGGLFISIGYWIFLREHNIVHQEDYWLFFAFPLFFSLGIFLGVYFILAYLGQRAQQIRFTRSLYGALRGGAFYALIITAFIPLVHLLLFTVSVFGRTQTDLDYAGSQTLISTLSSFASVVAGYFTLSRKSSTGESMLNTILTKISSPLLSLLVLIFVGLSATAIIRLMSMPALENYLIEALIISFVLFLISGIFVNSNKLSLHYFYRDRLSEAYLRTDGRVLRRNEQNQGMPLINLRNDEDLRMKNMGWLKVEGEELERLRSAAGEGHFEEHYRYEADGDIWKPNPRGPYHIIVTALNLQGSNELVRKDLKSDHFIFSRNYIGSQSTGYIRSEAYRRGRTKLARAMTISAAAVSSGMGFTTFFAQSFFTTLLNLRLGYWVENPWFYRNSDQEVWVNSRFRYMLLRLRGYAPVAYPKTEGNKRYCLHFSPKRTYTFWPYYLLQEMLGLTKGSSRLVNVSDGGHTGDNLGILPLLRRRCKNIVVCDFEEDNRFGFQSFNHLIRMANIEENIEIAIDLKPLEHKKEEDDDDELPRSWKSVTVGTIKYPDMTQGKLYYIKSSISQKNRKKLPVSVYNYRKIHPDFPHQSTADQYFDDQQFEAYRALGAHLADEFANILDEEAKEAAEAAEAKKKQRKKSVSK